MNVKAKARKRSQFLRAAEKIVREAPTVAEMKAAMRELLDQYRNVSLAAPVKTGARAIPCESAAAGLGTAEPYRRPPAKPYPRVSARDGIALDLME